ncbi:MAG: YHS domain-containing protein [Acidimicrobiia bacterium]
MFGMTVEVGSARHKTDHDGASYYFCCAGCLKAFEKDPVSFAGSETKP